MRKKYNAGAGHAREQNNNRWHGPLLQNQIVYGRIKIDSKLVYGKQVFNPNKGS